MESSPELPPGDVWDDESRTPYDAAVERLLKQGLDEGTASALGRSHVFDQLTVQQVIERLEHMFRSMPRDQVERILRANPNNILRPVARVDGRLNWLVLELGIPLQEAQEILEQCFAILELSDSDFHFKCRTLARLIPNAEERLVFLLVYPQYFLIPFLQLSHKSALQFVERAPGKIWDALTASHNGQAVELEAYPLPARPPRRRWSDEQRDRREPRSRPPSDLEAETPPPPAPDPREAVVPDALAKLACKEAGLEEPPRVIPPPPSDAGGPTEATSIESEPPPPSLHQAPLGELPVCRIPMPHVTPVRALSEISEDRAFYARSVVAFLTHTWNLGLNWDIARPYVMYRPWMTDPNLNVLRVLETLVAAGIRGDALWKALKHEPFFALGYDELEHVMVELRRNRNFPLPDDIRDLAIPRRMFNRRMLDLSQRKISPQNPLYKKAIYANTQQEFHDLLDSSSPSKR
ncbi:hypothetical protein HY479_02150 [Candidatus Uhrbacteria bacterium]|nr:hypothetical protein [Candidatus Uhrbacteria bacterium]